MSRRADLLALTDDSLAALANRGLVKRAVREVEAGGGPHLDEDDDGTVTASWPDGTVVRVPRGTALPRANCSCTATGVCRHRVMLALAYRGAGGPPPVEVLAPGAFPDEQLAEHVGPRAMAAAQRALRSGFTARVRRPSASDPVPTVELASVTVRFLVAGELGYARADAADGARPDALVLAVWAWRAADERDPEGAVVDVQVGGGSCESHESALELAAQALADLLAVGVSGAGSDVDLALAGARRALDGRDLRWPVDVVDDLVAALGDYRGRTSAYEPALAARHVAELVGRVRGAGGLSCGERPRDRGGRADAPAARPAHRPRSAAARDGRAAHAGGLPGPPGDGHRPGRPAGRRAGRRRDTARPRPSAAHQHRWLPPQRARCG